MFANDRVGDCTVASSGHLVQVWTTNASGHRARLTTPGILTRYEAISGYVPGDDSSDVGANERDVLKYWLKNPLMGHGISAFAATALPDHLDSFKQALWAYGGLYIGLDLPVSAERQIRAHQPWNVVDGDEGEVGSWGGHAVACVAYGPDGLEVIT